MAGSEQAIRLRRSVAFAMFAGAFSLGFMETVVSLRSGSWVPPNGAFGPLCEIGVCALVAAFAASLLSQVAKASPDGWMAGLLTAALFPIAVLLLAICQVFTIPVVHHLQWQILPVLYLIILLLALFAVAIGMAAYRLLVWLFGIFVTKMLKTAR
jgi:hypothetical protein